MFSVSCSGDTLAVELCSCVDRGVAVIVEFFTFFGQDPDKVWNQLCDSQFSFAAAVCVL